MNDRDRLEQLRTLCVRLERMPASVERDWMLGEVRARAVDVETGVEPSAMRALAGDAAEPEVPAPAEASRGGAAQTVPPPEPRRRPASRVQAAHPTRGARHAGRATPAAHPSPATARPRAAHESVVDLLDQGGVLCLEDQPAVADGASRPWSGGLRG